LLMVAVLFLLAAANVLYRMGEGGPVGSIWSGVNDLSENYSPRLIKTMNDLDALPELTFSAGKAQAEEGKAEGRNPFLFGVDRARERVQKERLAALDQAREEALVDRSAETVLLEPVDPPATFDGRVLGTMLNTRQGTYLLSVEFEQEIHILSEGQILAERYKLLAVSDTSVRFLHLGQQKEIEIKLED